MDLLKLGKGSYEVLVLENDDEKLYDELEEVTEFFILTVDMVHIEKEKTRVRGAMRKIKSPLGMQFAPKQKPEEEQKADEAKSG